MAAEQPLGLRLALTATSAVIAEAFTFPIDITKTRMQLHGEMLRTRTAPPGAVNTALGIFQEEGPQGLFRGLSPALLRHVFYTSTRVMAYEQLRHAALMSSSSDNRASFVGQAVLGGIAGIIGQIIASPADLIKVRMQSDGRLVKLGVQPRYNGILDAFNKIVREDGVMALWKGLGPNVQRAFLVNMGELASYDQSKQLLIHRNICDDNIYAHTLASVMSGFCATALSCPADVVKTRMMNQMSNMKHGGYVYQSSLDCAMKTVQAEGVKALWKGFFPTWARLGPWQLIFWVSYEQLRHSMGLMPF